MEQFQGGLRESHSLFSESLRVKDVMEIMEEAEGLDINDENGGFSFQELLACETSAQTRWENCKRSFANLATGTRSQPLALTFTDDQGEYLEGH